MESFGLSYNDILWKYDWLTLNLLMLDKMRYVGTKKDGKDKKSKTKKADIEMDAEETDEFFKSLM